MKDRKVRVEHWPWDQLRLEPAEVSAIKAIPDAAFNAIMKIANVDGMSFTSGAEDGRRATDFAEGKRWIGNTLRRIRAMKLPERRQQETGPHAVPKGAPPE